jgi:hypothetical protein
MKFTCYKKYRLFKSLNRYFGNYLGGELYIRQIKCKYFVFELLYMQVGIKEIRQAHALEIAVQFSDLQPKKVFFLASKLQNKKSL